MPRAKLTVTLPERVWVQQVSTAVPAVTFRVLSVLADEGAGVGLLELSGPDGGIDEVLDAMDAADGVEHLDVLQQVDGRALVRFETTSPLLVLAAKESGVPLDLPLTIRDGKASLELTTPHERLSEMGDQLRSLGLTYSLEYVTPLDEEASLLSDRQRELLETAVDLGYYDTPRGCTLTDLADHLGIAKSTASERVHRAESAVVRAYVADPESAGAPSAARSGSD